MVSGLRTSPNDHARICSGDAKPMRMASKLLTSMRFKTQCHPVPVNVSPGAAPLATRAPLAEGPYLTSRQPPEAYAEPYIPRGHVGRLTVASRGADGYFTTADCSGQGQIPSVTLQPPSVTLSLSKGGSSRATLSPPGTGQRPKSRWPELHQATALLAERLSAPR